MKETRYLDRTDSFEEKVRSLQAAYKDRKFELAMALAESIRDTVIFTRQEEEDEGTPELQAEAFGRVEELPQPWRQWARGWSFYKLLTFDETVGMARTGEPVDLLIGFRADQTISLAREVRVARIEEQAGTLREIPCQVYREVRRGKERVCRLAFFADSPAHLRTTYLVFYGNSDAELTDYTTDLKARGEGVGLEIENEYYLASLSPQMGQLERLTYKRDPSVTLFASGEGHGEPPTIDWGHDYIASGNFQKFRMKNWAQCANYEVVRGPIVVKVRRWGFPHSPLHPVFTPSRMHMTIEYRFYAGAPYFIKQGSMEMIKDFEIVYLRDDEWLFSGYPFTDAVWMGSDGKLRMGPVEESQKENLWAVGFFSRRSRDAFIALRLEHRAEHFDGLRHGGVPLVDYPEYPGHGQLWSRWAAHGNPSFSAGAVLKQKNAYLVLPFPEQGGAELVEGYRHRLLNPLLIRQGDLSKSFKAAPSAGALARPGEVGDSPIDKRQIWEALRECKDEQFYTVDANVADMGYIYDVRVRGDVIHLVMTMPHRGRPKFGYIANPIRQRLMKLAGVREVLIEHVWEPAWTPSRLTDAGRKAFGL